MYLFRPLTFIFFILSTGSVYAENTIEVRYFYSELASNPIVQELIENVQPPDHLFHWAREHRSLRHNQDDRPWYLKLLKRRPTTPLRGDRLEMPDFNNAIFSSFTDNRAALYFWSHPATGMGMSSGENYTYIDSESGKTPSLVVAKPSSDATYSVYVSGAKGFVHDDSIIAAATDFVLHILSLIHI